MANDRNFKIKNGLDVEGGSLTQTKSGDSRSYFRSSTSDRAYAYFQNSDTGTADSDGLAIGINSAETAIIYHSETAPVYIGSNGILPRLSLESDGDFLVYNTAGSTVVAKFNASTENVELAGDIVFEGSTADANETTVTVTDPTADRTFTIPDQTGTAMLWQQPWPDDPASNNIAIGDGALAAITSSHYHNTAVGQGALNAVTSSYNTAFGRESAKQVTTGNYNTTMGHRSGGSDTASSTGMDYVVAIGGNAGASTYGDSNVIVGFTAAQYAGSAYSSVAVGYYAGYEMGAFSTVVGYHSGYNSGMNSSAQGTTALGYSTAKNITSGDWNTCIGPYADVGTFSGAANRNTVIGVSATGGYSYNVCIGTSSSLGLSTSAASHNVAMGFNSGSQSDADYGVYIGRNAGYKVNADNCIFLGDYAGGYLSKSGVLNVGVGYRTLYDLTSGNTNTALGAAAGYKCSSGYRNVYVGNNAGGTSTTGHATGYNSIIIGYNAIPSSTSAANEITLGDSTITSLRCNVTTISSLSDERDKTDIEDLPYGLDFINDMRPVQFTWDRRDGSMNNVPDFGFIAQDLHDVELEHSSTNRTRLVKWENPDKLEADYVRSYPILVKAVQELSAKCDALEARLAALEGV